MKFSGLQENINRGLLVVSHVAGKNVALPILSNVLVRAHKGGLELTSTNLELGVRAQVRGKTDEEGDITVQAQILSNFVNLLPNKPVDLEIKGTQLTVVTEGRDIKMNGIASGEFPVMPVIERKEEYVITGGILRTALSQVMFAVQTNEVRPEISGVLFSFHAPEAGTLTLVGTDSYRLAERKIALEGETVPAPKKVIVPLRTCQEIMRILAYLEEKIQVRIAFGEGQMIVVMGEVELVSRLIEGRYPDYEQIIPKNSKTQVIVDTSELSRAVKQASLFCSGGINDVHLSFDAEHGLTLAATNQQLGESSSQLQASVSGEKNRIVFNYRYLLDGLQNIPTAEVVIETVSDAAPGVLRPVNDKSYLYLIMPIKQ